MILVTSAPRRPQDTDSLAGRDDVCHLLCCELRLWGRRANGRDVPNYTDRGYYVPVIPIKDC